MAPVLMLTPHPRSTDATPQRRDSDFRDRSASTLSESHPGEHKRQLPIGLLGCPPPRRAPTTLYTKSLSS